MTNRDRLTAVNNGNDADPDAHLFGTPWWEWRATVADMLGIDPVEVTRMPGAYEAFNTLVSEADYVADVGV